MEIYAIVEGARPKLIDVGVWRACGYVRWRREKQFPDFFVLDRLDEMLRRRFKRNEGTIYRGAATSFAKMVEMSPL